MEEEDALLIFFFHTLVDLYCTVSIHLSDATFHKLTRLQGTLHAAPIVCCRKDDQKRKKLLPSCPGNNRWMPLLFSLKGLTVCFVSY